MKALDNLRQSLRWLTVGALTAAIDITLFTMLYGLRVPLVPANITSSASGLLFGYLAHRRWSFDHDGSHIIALPRFLTTYAVNLSLNTAATGMALNWAHLASFPSKMVALAVQTPASFLLMRQWVFSPRTRKIEPQELREPHLD